MIKRLFNVYRNILKINKIEKNQARLFSLMNISKLFDNNTFIPFTAWSLSPFAIEMLLNDILINNRKSIIEFGSGNSTVFIAKLIKVYDLDTVFFSVESDKEWVEKVKKQLEKENCLDKVVFINAGSTNVSKDIAFKNQLKWFDTEFVSNSLPKNLLYDLVLVDAPGANESTYSRFSAVPFLKELLANSFSIYLDDIQRGDELEIAKEWSNILGVNYEIFDSVAIFVKGHKYAFIPSYRF